MTTALRACRSAALLAALLAAPAAAGGASILRVGPGEAFATIAEAARQARSGDTVLIAAGEYRGDVAVWTQARLDIRATGSGAVLLADGRSAEGKAIWVVRGGDIRIDNIEFRGARVADGNGAGIRFERGRLTVHNCRFIDNQNGILTANDANAELIIRDSVFGPAIAQDTPLPHLLYVGRIASLDVRGSHFRDGHRGHLVKSRARASTIRYNLIADGPEGQASYAIDLPNGGRAEVVGNIVAQNERSANPALIAFGAEGQPWPHSHLLLAHNTLLGGRPLGAWLLRVWEERLPADSSTTLLNNLAVGSALYAVPPGTRSAGNAQVPATAFDLRTLQLDPRHLPRQMRPAPAAGDPARPTAAFVPPAGRRTLPADAPLPPGAAQVTH